MADVYVDAQGNPVTPDATPKTDDVYVDAQGNPIEQPSTLSRIGTGIEDLGKGALKGLGQMGIAGGSVLRMIPGVDALSNRLPSANVDVTPNDTMQEVGSLAPKVAFAVAVFRMIAANPEVAASIGIPLAATAATVGISKGTGMPTDAESANPQVPYDSGHDINLPTEYSK